MFFVFIVLYFMLFIWKQVLCYSKGMPFKTKQVSNLSVFQPKPIPVRASCMLEKNVEGFFLWNRLLVSGTWCSRSVGRACTDFNAPCAGSTSILRSKICWINCFYQSWWCKWMKKGWLEKQGGKLFVVGRGMTHTAVQLQSPGLTGLISACPGVTEHFPIAGKGVSLSLLSGYWLESLTPSTGCQAVHLDENHWA